MTPSFLSKHYKTFDYYEYHGLTDALRRKLEHDFHVQEEDLEDIFSPLQLSKYEIRDSYVYFALQFADRDTTGRIYTQQIHCFVSTKFLVVIDEDGFLGIQEFDRLRNRLVDRENYNSFDLFYELLDISVVRMFGIVNTLHAQMRAIESSVFSEDHF